MKHAFLSLILFASVLMPGQVNIVPNPSFENYDTCPYMQDQLHFASPWFKPTPNSSDLYNACSTDAGSTVPLNWTGDQQPRTGNGYAGIAVYGYQYNGLDNRREYLAVQLTTPLTAGKTYCAEFYASYADSSFWAVNRLGLHFSVQPIIDNLTIDTITATPQIYHDTTVIITDDDSWIRISGSYVATGGEEYITIGNFYADDQTDTISNLGNFIWAYFYIDDVAVYELQECQAGADVVICYEDSAQLGVAPQPNVFYTWFPSDGISDVNSANPKASPELTTTYVLMQYECDVLTSDTVTVIVNQDCHAAPSVIMPTLLQGDQEFFIQGLESNSRLEIFDARGRSVYSSDDYQNDFRIVNLDQAVYVAVLTRPNQEQIVKKVCVVR